MVIPLILDFYFNQRYYAEMMYDSGVFSAQLLVFSLAITPHMMITRSSNPGARIMRWFFRRRRYIGVACFCYAVIHTLVYIRNTGDFENVLWQIQDIEIALGWTSLFILLLLALTSNDGAVRSLGRGWKKLHRFVYLAAILTGLHWILFDLFVEVLLLWFIPLGILQIYRVWVRQ